MGDLIRSCVLCKSLSLQSMVDFNEQPISTNYIDDSLSIERKFTLKLGVCLNCGLVQLTDSVSISDLSSPYEWISYNEPENHLDDFVHLLSEELSLESNSNILGLSYKDDSTLKRLKIAGFDNVISLDYTELVEKGNLRDISIIQSLLLDDSLSSKLSGEYQPVDLIIARHILEHTDSIFDFLSNICKFLKPDGVIAIELPDCDKVFSYNNHPFIWEEHISYINSDTLNTIASLLGLELFLVKKYEYDFEDSLIAIFRYKNSISLNDSVLGHHTINNNISVVSDFNEALSSKRHYWKSLLSCSKSEGNLNVIFGAGHLSVKFINMYQLEHLIDFVIDDDVNKAGLLMPGSQLSIVSSDKVDLEKSYLNISTLSPESAARAFNTNIFLKSGVTSLNAFSK